MKIGILTFTDGTNYGQRLQNYALQELLISSGHEVYTVVQEYKYSTKHKVKVMLQDVIHFKAALWQKKRKQSFAEFNTRYIRFYSEKISETADNTWLSQEFDLFIAGSDQIWNPHSPFVNKNFFLQFASKEKRATYAVSFSVDSIPEKITGNYQKWISGIPYLGVRELKAVELVKTMTAKDADLVLDPTLMIEQKKWEMMIDTCSNVGDIQDDYAISLFLGNDYSEEEKNIEEKTGLRLVTFKEYETVGPESFLKLIRNASLVLTDSYHATIFSILMNTPFIVFSRKSNGSSMNSRFETLNYYFDIEPRVWGNIMTHEDMWLIDDFHRYKNRLEDLQKGSWLYINNMLCEREKQIGGR